MTPSRKGVGAMLFAYVILFTLIGATVGVVLLGGDRSQAIVSLRPAPTATPASKPEATRTTATPVGTTAATAQPPSKASEAAPLKLPAAAPPPPPPVPAQSKPDGATDSGAAAATEPTPPQPDKQAETPQAAAMTRASLYPPPPPEKPDPTKFAASAPPKSAPQVAAASPIKALMPPAMLEPGPHGPLPRIAPDGRLPWIVNNGRFDHGTRKPRIGIVLAGLGLNPQVTEDAIVQLPPEITLAFVPYAPDLPRWVELARQFGHEVLLSLPLESGSAADPGLGPRMLSTQSSSAENLDRLRWVLSRASGYVGVLTWEGEKLMGSGQQILPVLQELASRGLMVVDSRQARSNVVQQQADALGLPFAKSRGFLDAEAGVAALDRNLQQLESLSQRAGFGVAMAVAFPDNVKRLVDWSRTVGQRGFALAPITGVSECKDLCQRRVARHGEAVSEAGR